MKLKVVSFTVSIFMIFSLISCNKNTLTEIPSRQISSEKIEVPVSTGISDLSSYASSFKSSAPISSIFQASSVSVTEPIDSDTSGETSISKISRPVLSATSSSISASKPNSSSSPSSSTVDYSKQVIEGNGGEIVKCGNWIYFCINGATNLSNYLSKVQENKPYRITLDRVSTIYIYIANGWIYYVTKADPMTNKSDLLKIREDGSMKTKICSGDFTGIKVYGDWIYLGRGSLTHKVRTDGTDFQEIPIQTYFNNFYFIDNKLYFIRENSLAGLSVMNQDGTDIQDNIYENIYYPTIKGNKIYYINQYIDNENGSDICSINIDFTGKKVLDSTNRWIIISISDDWCFCMSYNNEINQSFYRFRSADGSDKQLINVIMPGQSINAPRRRIHNLKALGSWVYLEIDSRWYRCKPDGSGMEKLTW